MSAPSSLQENIESLCSHHMNIVLRVVVSASGSDTWLLMSKMTSWLGVAVLALCGAAPGAEASNLRCETHPSQHLLSSRTRLFRVQDQLAERFYLGDLRAERSGKIRSVYLEQRCKLRRSAWEGVTLRFELPVKEADGSLSVRYCYSRLYRMKGYRTESHRWGEWLLVDQACRRDESFHPQSLADYELPGAMSTESTPSSLRDVRLAGEVLDPRAAENPRAWGLEDGEGSDHDPYSPRESGEFEDWGDLLH
jgi:hypothetical protein